MKNTRQNSAGIKKKVTNVLVHLFLTILSVIWVFPIFWVVLLSFREQKGQYITSFWPKKFTMANYVKLFTDTALFNFPKWFLNTLFVAICSCILTTFFVLAISYCLSRLRFKIRKPYMNVAMILGMFPGFMSMIAVYYILKGFGLTKGPMIFLALIMVYSGGAGLGFYVSKGFFDTIPKALDEAAIVDGATKCDVFSKIIMPLSKPIIVSTIMTSFMAPWLDFIFAKVIAGADPRYYTVAIGLYTMLTKENIVNWYACFAAGAVCVSIPIAILFLNLQKYYAEGMSGAVKGLWQFVRTDSRQPKIVLQQAKTNIVFACFATENKDLQKGGYMDEKETEFNTMRSASLSAALRMRENDGDCQGAGRCIPLLL